MGKMGKRYLVFDGRTMPVLKKKNNKQQPQRKRGRGKQKMGQQKRGQ
jgi:hypothetical protein